MSRLPRYPEGNAEFPEFRGSREDASRRRKLSRTSSQDSSEDGYAKTLPKPNGYDAFTRPETSAMQLRDEVENYKTYPFYQASPSVSVTKNSHMSSRTSNSGNIPAIRLSPAYLNNNAPFMSSDFKPGKNLQGE